MKLWLLKPVKKWAIAYDKTLGFVVRADTERDARFIASSCCAAEGPKVWQDARRTFCTELLAEGKSGVVLSDVLAG